MRLAGSRNRPDRKPQPRTAPSARDALHELPIWHHEATEFPIAIVRPRDLRARVLSMLGDLQRWLAMRWAWFKPRTLPLVVTAIGMTLVFAAADYVARAATNAVDRSTAALDAELHTNPPDRPSDGLSVRLSSQ